jgi:hypothetical protein
MACIYIITSVHISADHMFIINKEQAGEQKITHLAPNLIGRYLRPS